MTAIAAVAHGGKVYVGGDSAGVSGLSLTQRQDAKVFVNGPMVFGFTTSFRMGQILRWSFVPPVHQKNMDDEKYMAVDFVDAVRAALKAGGFAKIESSVESAGTFIVGYQGRIWTVHDDYQIAEPLRPFDAVGSGDDLCLGSLFATSDWDDPEERVVAALSAAEAFNAGVRGPFKIVREP